MHASDLKLPPGVSLQVEPETLVLAVIARTIEEEPEEEAQRRRRCRRRWLRRPAGSEGEQAG